MALLKRGLHLRNLCICYKVIRCGYMGTLSTHVLWHCDSNKFTMRFCLLVAPVWVGPQTHPSLLSFGVRLKSSK